MTKKPKNISPNVSVLCFHSDQTRQGWHHSARDPLENDCVTPLSVDLAKEVKYKAEAAV